MKVQGLTILFQSCCDDKNLSIYKLNETQEAELEKENTGISFGQVLIWFYLVFVVGIMVVDFFRSGIRTSFHIAWTG